MYSEFDTTSCVCAIIADGLGQVETAQLGTDPLRTPAADDPRPPAICMGGRFGGILSVLQFLCTKCLWPLQFSVSIDGADDRHRAGKPRLYRYHRFGSA